jgi:hypothetical protein
MTTATANTNAGQASEDFLGMSDEDFLKMSSPTSKIEAVEDKKDLGETPGSSSAADQNDKGGNDDASGEDAAATPSTVVSAAAGDEHAKAGAAVVVADKASDKAPPAAAGQAAQPTGSAAEGAVAKDAAGQGQETPPDYEGFFKQIMTPFKANGRTIELKTPEEAIRLMQMGAGYGRKIQDLQPHLKVLRMLEKNNLLDESRLSFLIDVSQKNPDAIKKVVKDSGIDPLDINTEGNVNYSPKNHSVSDREMAFQEALSDIQRHDNGHETLQTINREWDEESKAVLWENPELLGVIQTQRDTGLYDQIVAEIDRQRLLGKIPNNAPFLQAYRIAGDHLQATNGFKVSQDAQVPNQKQPGVTPQTQVLATKAATPKAPVQNGDKAAAAAPTKTVGSRKAGTFINPLEMADDDFLKQFNGRF